MKEKGGVEEPFEFQVNVRIRAIGGVLFLIIEKGIRVMSDVI